MKLMPWIRYLRLPALLTVPGDVLVGVALSDNPFAWQSLTGVCLAYLFGMALNDLADLNRDRRARPERPLPRGDISRVAALRLCAGLGLSACLVNPTMPQLLLLATIVLYTWMKNHHPLAGAFCMAACRGLGVWIGGGEGMFVSAEPAIVTGFWMLLVFQITLLADKEDRTQCPAIWQSRLLSGCWLTAPLLALYAGHGRFPMLFPSALLMVLAMQNQRQINVQGGMRPQNTGVWLSMLIPLQSLFVMARGWLWVGALLLGLWPALRWCLRKLKIS